MDKDSQFEESALKSSKKIKIIFIDGKHGLFKYKSMTKYNLLVESESELILLPKHSIKYCVIKEYEIDPLWIKLKDVMISSKLQQVLPNEKKIGQLIKYFKANKTFNNPLKVRKINEKFLLTDGLSRFIAAQKAGVESIEVRIEKEIQ